MAQIFKAKTLLASSGKFSYEAIAPNLIYNTGNQNIVGTKTFVSNLEVQGTGIFNALDLSNISEFNFSGTNINLINGNVNISGGTLYISGNAVLTGVNLDAYATITNLASTGSRLQTQVNTLNTLTRQVVYATGNQNVGGNKTFTGIISFSGQQINVIDTALNLSGVGDMTFDSTNINFINSPVFISGTNLRITGDIIANNLVYNIGNQTIGGLKTFNLLPIVSGNKLITGVDLSSYATVANLASTGSTLDVKINNLSGVSVLTFGNQTINGLKTFTSGIDIYSGINPQSIRVFNTTGTNSGEFGLIGWINNQFIIGSQQSQSGILRDVVITGNNININGSGALNIFDNTNIVGNLNVTGNILLSGNQVLTGSSTLYATSSTLNTRINNLSGYINSSSSNIVFTTGNQIISGEKTFLNNIKVSGSGIFNALDLNNIDTLNLSGVDINISNGNVTLTSPPIITGNYYQRVTTNIISSAAATITVFTIPLLANKIYEVDQYFKFTTYLANSFSSMDSAPANSISTDGYRYGFNNTSTFLAQNAILVGGVNGLNTFLMGDITGVANHIRKGILRPSQNCNIIFNMSNIAGNQTTLENGSYAIVKRIT